MESQLNFEKNLGGDLVCFHKGVDFGLNVSTDGQHNFNLQYGQYVDEWPVAALVYIFFGIRLKHKNEFSISTY